MTAVLAPWLTDDHSHKRALIERALKDVGVCEEPLNSNRGPQVDTYLRNAGVPDSVIKSGKGYWCASALYTWFMESGNLDLAPPIRLGPASCDVWMKWAIDTGRWFKLPVEGSVVLYGVPGDAQHIGLVVRVHPLIYGVEGNTTAGGSYNRDGAAVDARGVNLSRVLGYYHPFAPAKTP